jgi:GT2 family glycosyltransferase
MKISVMITTRNRASSLQRTLECIKTLDPQPFEILVTADACSDETIRSILSTNPEVVLIVNSEGQGSVASRHRMMQMAHGDLVLALDDDSYTEQKDCLAIIPAFFQQNPRLAVATFPQRTDEYPETLSQSDFGRIRAVRSFASSGACLRVEAYRSLDGFQEHFFHMYEEPDYALQCIANDWEVCFSPSVTIRHHWVGDARSELKNHHRHARNESWSALMRCPMPFLIGILIARVISQASFAATRGLKWFCTEPCWWFAALIKIHFILSKRKPVAWEHYKRWLALPDK